MIRWLSVVLFVWLHTGLFGQIVNIENKRVFDDTSGWYGTIDGSFSMIQNKNVLYQANLRGKIQYKTHKHYFLFLQDFVYSGGASVYANSGMAHFRYAYRLWNSAWKWESYAQVQYNQLLQQRSRSLAGTGLRVKFLDKPSFKGFAGSSLFYEYEEIQQPQQFISNLRWSNYVSWFYTYKHLTFTGTSYFQPDPANFEDFRFAGQYSLLIQINKIFRIKSEYNVFHDSRPPEGVRHTVSSFMFGISCEFGK